MGRYKKYLIFFMFFWVCQYSNASLDAWNSAKSQEIRNKIAQDANYGADSGRITVHNYDRTKAMVEASMKASGSVDGSKASVTAKVKTPVNMGKVATTTIKRLAKGGIPGMIGGAALQALVNEVGWVIDSSTNIIYRPGSIKAEYYTISGNEKKYQEYSTLLTELKTIYNCNRTDVVTPWSATNSTLSSQRIKCFTSSTGTAGSEIWTYAHNTTEPQKIPVSAPELANKLNEKNDSNTDTIVKSAYTPTDSSGKASPNLNDLLNGLNDTIKDIVNDFNDIIKSDNPTTTGKTDTTPTITFNNTTINNDNTTVVNEDGSTTTTGTSNFELPAWCDWAFDMCTWHQEDKQHQQEETTFWQDVKAWFDWTKEEPEKQNNELDFDDSEENEPDTKINFSTACPQKIPLQFGWNGHTLDFSFDFTIWCDAVSTFIYPIVVALGSLHALYIVAGVRQDG